jgi:hypothetical protein
MLSVADTSWQKVAEKLVINLKSELRCLSWFLCHEGFLRNAVVRSAHGVVKPCHARVLKVGTI